MLKSECRPIFASFKFLKILLHYSEVFQERMSEAHFFYSSSIKKQRASRCYASQRRYTKIILILVPKVENIFFYLQLLFIAVKLLSFLLTVSVGLYVGRLNLPFTDFKGRFVAFSVVQFLKIIPVCIE